MTSAFAPACVHLLEQLRAHKHFGALIDNLRANRDDWSGLERCATTFELARQQEAYPGEARERRESYDLLLKLLGEMP